MLRPRLVLGALGALASACASNHGRKPEPPPAVEPPAAAAPDAASEGLRLRPPAPGERASLVQLHMADHYADLRLMERALVAGDLSAVRTYATALALDRSDPELAGWATSLERMREAAGALAAAADLATASRREAALAARCGACHLESGAQLPFADDGPLPDDGTTPARMQRHQWAADRLWQALIAPSTTAWRDGLAVLADTPLPDSELGVDATRDTARRMGQLARRLQAAAVDADAITELERRAEAYGEVLATCAACHALR